MIVLGRLALIFALVFSLAAVLFLTIGAAQRRRDVIRQGYLAVYLFFISIVASSAILLTAFLNKNYTFDYVAQNSAASLKGFYRVAGFWAGQAGSFLLWVLLLGIVTAVIALRNAEESDRVTAGAVAVLSAVSAFFAAVMIIDHASNPFIKAAAGTAALGLNPLLLHPAMVLHPPALFAGYVGLTVPFAFAVSALTLGRSDREWVLRSQRWGIAGWALLSLGIGLGAWWAYVVLSWGGYWGWDPVENGSLIPWLAATALLHSMNGYVRRGILKRATVALAGLTFFLTILATWTTRTGKITSVHAYQQNNFLFWALNGLLLAIAVVTIVTLVTRWRLLRSDVPEERFTWRDFSYLTIDVVLAALAIAMTFTNVVDPFFLHGTVGTDTYNRFAQPLGVLVLIGIALCPLLRPGRLAGMAVTLIGGTALLVITVVVRLAAGGTAWLPHLAWNGKLTGVIGLIACCYAVAAVLSWVITTARAGVRTHGWAHGVRRALTTSRPRTAGFVAHFGMVVILAGLIGSNIYKVETSAYIAAKAGATAKIGDYSLSFQRFRQGPGPQASTRVYADFKVAKNGRDVGTLSPRTDLFPSPDGAALRAVIRGSAGEDLFVVGQDPFDTTAKNLRLQLDIFPLVRFVWVGALMLVAGAVVGLWPGGRPRLATAGIEDGADGEGAYVDDETIVENEDYSEGDTDAGTDDDDDVAGADKE